MVVRYGGTLGVRSLDVLESALAQPKQTFDGRYVHKTLFGMAAAYLFHIVKNHPFIDGNKRVGAAAADVFLYTNGYDFQVNPLDYENIVLETVVGKTSKNDLATYFQKNSKRISNEKSGLANFGDHSFQ